MSASIGVLDALTFALSLSTNREEEKDEACETTTVAWRAGAAALAARERRIQGCFLKLWALRRYCSWMFFSPVFVDSASLRNGEPSQICGPHWKPTVEKWLVFKNASDSNSEHFFYTSLERARTVEPVFHAVLFPVAFMDFLCTDRQVSSRKRDRACWISQL